MFHYAILAERPAIARLWPQHKDLYCREGSVIAGRIARTPGFPFFFREDYPFGIRKAPLLPKFPSNSAFEHHRL